jgi:pimeloyl-ACP methyl ester carboxylesterase
MEPIQRLGTYLRVDEANIYYETYGSGGTPLVLLHGGLYGYIEEFGELIGELSKHRGVIAIATRGHGRSEIGTKPFSYALFASDAVAVIHHETRGKVDLLGFSDGAVTSYALVSAHPELIRRLVAIGGPQEVYRLAAPGTDRAQEFLALRRGEGLTAIRGCQEKADAAAGEVAGVQREAHGGFKRSRITLGLH